MNEMTEVKEFRSEITTSTPGRVPDFLRYDEGVAGASHRGRWLVGAGGLAAAAALVTGLLVAQAGPGASPSAAEVLDRAADHVAAESSGPRPRDDQWVYESNLEREVGDSGTPDLGEGWTRFDGSEYAVYAPSASDHLVAQRLRDGQVTPAQMYDGLAALPDDPRALLEKLRAGDLVDEKGSSRAARDFDGVSDCLEQAPVLSPQAHARLFRALATIPGVAIDEHAAPDLAGQEVLSVTWTGEPGSGFDAKNRHELLLDPSTYDYRGERVTALADFTLEGGRDSVRTGETWYDSAEPASGIVDRAGERP